MSSEGLLGALAILVLTGMGLLLLLAGLIIWLGSFSSKGTSYKQRGKALMSIGSVAGGLGLLLSYGYDRLSARFDSTEDLVLLLVILIVITCSYFIKRAFLSK